MKKAYILSFLLGFISLLSTAVQAQKNQYEVCPLSEKTPEKIYIDYKLDEPYVDLDRDIKDFGTKFIVQEFFKTKTTLFNFLELTYESIDSAIKEYRENKGLDERAIFLLFKGGNVLRIVANQVFSMISPEARELLEGKYAENFKRSDSDFGVFVDSDKLERKGLDYEEVMTEVTKLTYRALSQIREEFKKRPERYFNFLRLKQSYAQKVLGGYFAKLSELPAITDEKNSNWYQAQFKHLQLLDDQVGGKLKCKYEGQYDYRYEFDRNDKNTIIGIPLNKKTNWIMNSINKTLQWTVGDDPNKVIKFYLVRAKVPLEYIYVKDGELHRKPISAELSDVSFPHKDDFRVRGFLDDYDRLVAEYTLTLEGTDRSFTMKGESVTGLSEDIYEIVFEQFSRPWEASKYEKRINRLFFLAIVDMLSAEDLGIDRAKEYLKNVNEKVIDPLADLYPLQSDEARELQEQVQQNIDNIVDEFSAMSIANMVLKGMSTLVLKELIENPKDTDEDEFAHFLELIKDNLGIMNKLLEVKPGTIDIEDIYDAKMESLF